MKDPLSFPVQRDNIHIVFLPEKVDAAVAGEGPTPLNRHNVPK